MYAFQASAYARASAQHSCVAADVAVTAAATGNGGGADVATAAVTVRGVAASAIKTLSTAGPAQRTRRAGEVARFMGHLLAHQPRLEHRDGEFRPRAGRRAGDGDCGTIEHLPRPQRFVGEPGCDGALWRGDHEGLVRARAEAHEREPQEPARRRPARSRPDGGEGGSEVVVLAIDAQVVALQEGTEAQLHDTGDGARAALGGGAPR